MPHGKFATVIGCTDGRTIPLLTEYMKKRYNVDYVDVITEPGADRILSGEYLYKNKIESIKSRAYVSATARNSRVVAVAGHHGCEANDVTEAVHKDNVRHSMKTLKGMNLPFETIAGLWINDRWEVELLDELK